MSGPRHGKKAARDSARRANPKRPWGLMGSRNDKPDNQPLCEPNNDGDATRQQERAQLVADTALDFARQHRISLYAGYQVDLPRPVRRSIIRDKAKAAFRERRADRLASAAAGGVA
jgi:hypothetical protein